MSDYAKSILTGLSQAVEEPIPERIDSFRGKYFFLSNFYLAPVKFEDVFYTNNESAFQATKTTDKFLRLQFGNLNPSEAKARGRRVNLRSDWEEVKYYKMYEICRAKFFQNPILGIKLMDTGNAHLEEGNDWGDKIWGTVDGVGKNHLGNILMQVRKELLER